MPPSGGTTSTLTVNTTAPVQGSIVGSSKPHLTLTFASLLVFLAFGLGIFVTYKTSKRSWAGIYLPCFVLIGLGLQIGCGGGVANGGGGGSGGTPPGAYTITVNATVGSASHSTDVHLTVNKR